MTNRKVNVLARKIDAVRGRGNAKIDLRMALGKSTEPKDEPLGGKIRRCADGQNAGALALHHAFSAHRNTIQRIANDSKILTTDVRDHKSLALAGEKLDAKPFLKRLYLMAHGALRDAQLFSGSGEALASRRSFEGLDGVQRW